MLLFRQTSLHFLRDPVMGPLWFKLQWFEKNLGARLGLGFRPAGQVIKYLQPPARVLRTLPRRALESLLQTPPGALRRAQLPAPRRGVPGRAGGGGGSDPGALHPSAGVHGSEPAGPGPPPLREGWGPSWDTSRVSRCDSEERERRFQQLSFDSRHQPRAAPPPRTSPTLLLPGALRPDRRWQRRPRRPAGDVEWSAPGQLHTGELAWGLTTTLKGDNVIYDQSRRPHASGE